MRSIEPSLVPVRVKALVRDNRVGGRQWVGTVVVDDRIEEVHYIREVVNCDEFI